MADGFRAKTLGKAATSICKMTCVLKSGDDFTVHDGIGSSTAAKIQKFFDDDLEGGISDDDVPQVGDMSKRFKPTKAQKKKVTAELEKLKTGGYSVKDLKEMLAHNSQPKSGNKGQLMQKIAEYKIHGCLPLCPGCGAVKLKLKDDGSGLYYCKGYFDDGEFMACGYTTGKVDRPKWQKVG